jgi:hypothetical protein
VNRDSIRILRQEFKKIIPKKVTVTSVGAGGFCKFGRVHGSKMKSESSVVIPMKGNQNNNWKAS